jgi:hypothetical protein
MVAVPWSDVAPRWQARPRLPCRSSHTRLAWPCLLLAGDQVGVVAQEALVEHGGWGESCGKLKEAAKYFLVLMGMRSSEPSG